MSENYLIESFIILKLVNSIQLEPSKMKRATAHDLVEKYELLIHKCAHKVSCYHDEKNVVVTSKDFYPMYMSIFIDIHNGGLKFGSSIVCINQSIMSVKVLSI